MQALDAYIKKGRQFSEWVWFTGTGALLEGEAVCYDWDRGTQTAKDHRRLNYVEVPSTTNAQWFAGVAARAYSAKSTGQLIEIYRPGSTCNIYTKATNVIGVGLLTFDVTSGYEGWFRYSGLRGEGSAIPLQTVDRGTDEGVCQALLLGGEPSGGLEVVTAIDNTAIGTLMIGGTTLVTGVALTNGDCTYTLADGAIEGLRKLFRVITTEITTNDFVVTVSTGMRQDGTALQTITWAGAQTTLNMGAKLEWSESWTVLSLGDGEPDLG